MYALASTLSAATTVKQVSTFSHPAGLGIKTSKQWLGRTTKTEDVYERAWPVITNTSYSSCTSRACYNHVFRMQADNSCDLTSGTD